MVLPGRDRGHRHIDKRTAGGNVGARGHRRDAGIETLQQYVLSAGTGSEGQVIRTEPLAAVFRFKGLGVKLKRKESTAVMVTFAGWLLVKPSFTINCTI